MPLGCLVDKDGNIIDVETLTSGSTQNLKDKKGLVVNAYLYGRVDSSNIWPLTCTALLDNISNSLYPLRTASHLLGFNGTTWGRLILDPLTNSLATIDYAHHEIHQGAHFTIRRFVSLTGSGGATPQDDTYVIVGANKTLHMIVDASCETEMRFNLYEATTVSANGTNQTAYDNNRVTANTTDAVWYRNPTVTTVGTLLDTIYVGAGKNTGAQVSTRNEWILKKSTNYMFRVINLSATGGDFSIRLMYYEE